MMGNRPNSPSATPDQRPHLSVAGGSAPSLIGYISAACTVIGWKRQQVARRTGLSRQEIARRDRTGKLSPAQRKWLGQLVALHARYPNALEHDIPPGNLAPMLPCDVGVALLTIGWSERQLAARMGVHRTELRRGQQAGKALTPRESAWLRLLVAGHEALPAPVENSRRKVTHE